MSRKRPTQLWGVRGVLVLFNLDIGIYMVTEWKAKGMRYTDWLISLHVGLLDTDVYFNSLSEEEKLEANVLLWNGISIW